MENDRLTLKRIQDRDQAALAELYDRYSGLVYSLSLKIVRDPVLAQGVVQGTFVAVWQKAVQYDSEKARVSTWLISIARNLAIDRWRKEKRNREVGDLELVERHQDDSPMGDPLGSVIDNERRRVIQEALAEIPEEQRRVVYLSYFGGLSHQEIAERLGQPLGTVKTRILLGLDKLRRRLAPIFDDE